jgi:hypothetical protein
MAEAAQSTQQEFWRPPSHPIEELAVQESSVSSPVVACANCGTEFLLGSKFCHTCGGRRQAAVSSATQADAAVIAKIWEGGIHQVQSAFKRIPFKKLRMPELGTIKVPTWLHYLHFHEIKSRVGLSTGSLIAFVIGLACVAGALLVGLLTAKTLIDWQAIQFYRVEWLLAATASFVLGILLKKNEND